MFHGSFWPGPAARRRRPTGLDTLRRIAGLGAKVPVGLHISRPTSPRHKRRGRRADGAVECPEEHGRLRPRESWNHKSDSHKSAEVTIFRGAHEPPVLFSKARRGACLDRRGRGTRRPWGEGLRITVSRGLKAEMMTTKAPCGPFGLGAK